MIKVGIFGGTGRVGKMLIEQLDLQEEMELSTVYVVDEVNFTVGRNVLVTNSIQEFLKNCELIIDFTIPKGTEQLLEACLENPKALVIGTTGLESHQQNLLKQAGEKMPILYATNMSLGVAMLNKLVYEVSKTLPDFDIEIVEMHHKHKIDSPSGTALTLAEHAAKGRDLDLDKVRVSGRDGIIGKRTKDEIAVMALRGGDIVGEHTVGFYADGEFIKLSHTATNRSTFAIGALKAGKWVVSQESGLYTIQDFLKL
jgi:4-hydroxy-tetrahydrodipicolinate reductase